MVRTIAQYQWFQKTNSFHDCSVLIIHHQFIILKPCIYLHTLFYCLLFPWFTSRFARVNLVAFEIPAIMLKTSSYISIFVLTCSGFNCKTADISAFSPSVFSDCCWRIFICEFMRSCTVSTYRLMLWSSCKAELKTIGKSGKNNLSISNMQFLEWPKYFHLEIKNL